MWNSLGSLPGCRNILNQAGLWFRYLSFMLMLSHFFVYLFRFFVFILWLWLRLVVLTGCQ